MSYVSRRFRYIADKDDCEIKIQDIRKHFEKKDELFVKNLLRLFACNDITIRMEFWQSQNIDNFEKKYRLTILNNIYKYIMNDIKFNKVIKELKYFYN